MNPFFAKKSNAQVGSSAFQEEKDTIDATTANSGTVHASVAASGGGFSGAASFQVNYLTFVKILTRKLKLDSMENCISLMYKLNSQGDSGNEIPTILINLQDNLENFPFAIFLRKLFHISMKKLQFPRL